MQKKKSALVLSETVDLYPTSVIIINEFGVIFNANSAAISLIGGKKGSTLSKNFLEYIDLISQSNFKKYFYKVTSSQQPQISEIKFKGIDNNYFDALVIGKSVTFPESKDKFCSLAIVDLTPLKMGDEVRRRSESRFEKMANTAPVMIWIADVEGFFSFVNKVWLDYTGKNLGDELGMNWLNCVHQDDYENLLKNYTDAIRNRNSFSYQFRLKDKNAEYQWILMKGTPRLMDEDKFTGFIGSCINIHSQVENEEKIKKINSELIESNETKDKFFSIIAHDLKSPVSGLSGLMDILSTSYDSLNEQERMEIITEASATSKSTYALIENLLDWARIQSGKFPLESTKFNLAALVSEVEMLFYQNLRNKSISFNAQVHPEIMVLADIKMTETILRNLISNAIKFTATNGTITVSAEMEVNFTTVKISDSGIGIEKEIIDNLFRIDISQSTRGTNKERGTGLGLILCKELAEMQGGSIWVESEKDFGSTFYFTLITSE